MLSRRLVRFAESATEPCDTRVETVRETSGPLSEAANRTTARNARAGSAECAVAIPLRTEKDDKIS